MSIPACHAGDRGSIPRRGVFSISTKITSNCVQKIGSFVCTLPIIKIRLLGSIVVSIPGCHAGDRDSIPAGEFLYFDTNICLIVLENVVLFLWATSN